jgi:hypothetical protein
VLDFDLEALAGLEAGVFEPTAGDFEPREKRRVGAVAAVGLPGAIAPRVLNRDMSLGMRGACVKIGVSHDRLLVRVDGGQRVVWVAAHAARAAFTAMRV